MSDADTPWITWAYDLGAVPGVFLVISTMIYTVHDEINRVASRWLRWTRQGSFTLMAVLLVNGMMSDASRLSLVLVFWSGILALIINQLALRERAKTGEQVAHAESQLD